MTLQLRAFSSSSSSSRLLLLILVGVFLPNNNNNISSVLAANSTTSCSACGEGYEITKPNAYVNTTNASYTCTEIQYAAENGLIDASNCLFIPVFAFTPCGCSKSTTSSSSAPVKAPVKAPTKAPTIKTTPSPTIAATTTTSSCSICAQGQTITKPDAIVDVPDIGSLPCQFVQSSADDGSVSSSICDILPGFATDCGCQSSSSGGGSSNSTTKTNTTKTTTAPTTTSTTSTPSISPVAPSSTSSSIAPTATSTSSTTNETRCSICAPGETLSKPDELVDVPNKGTFPCSMIQGAADAHQIPPENCPQLALIATQCGCIGAPPSTPTAALTPTVAPSIMSGSAAPMTTTTTNSTSGNTNSTSSSGNSTKICSICAAGETISKPDTILDIPGYGPFSCATLEGAANGGQVKPEQCGFLSTYSTNCGCMGGGGGATPTAPSAPSPPSSIDTRGGSEAPTLAGTYPPTPLVTPPPHKKSAAASGRSMMLLWQKRNMVGAIATVMGTVAIMTTSIVA